MVILQSLLFIKIYTRQFKSVIVKTKPQKQKRDLPITFLLVVLV